MTLFQLAYMTHLDGFILRSEAQEKYNRSKSSFIRDVDRAFRKDDFEFLSHLKVVLRDGTVIEGKKATKDKLREVSSDNPEWFIEESFLATGYWKKHGRKGSQHAEKSQGTSNAGSDSDGPLRTSREELLLAQIEELRRDKDVQRQQLERYDHTLNKTSELMSQLHVLLREMQDRLLPAPAARHEDHSAVTRQEPIRAEVTATPVSNTVVPPAPKHMKNIKPKNQRRGETRRWWQREIRIPFIPYE